MDLNQFLLIMKARRKTVGLIFAITVLVAVAVILMLPKVYRATATIVVNSSYADPVTGIQMQGMLLPAYLSTQVRVIESHNTALRVVKAMGLATDPKVQAAFNSATHDRGDINDWLADGLLKNLKVDDSHQSNDIAISYPSRNPQQSTDITNAFVDAYIQTSVDLKTQPARQTAEWYGRQLSALRNALETAQAKLSDYQTKYGVVLGNRVEREQPQLQAIVNQHVIAQAQNFDDASKLKRANGELIDVMKDPVAQALNTSLAQSEAKVSRLAQTEGMNNPEYQSALAEVDSYSQRLVGQIAKLRQSVRASADVSRQSETALRQAVSVAQNQVVADEAVKSQGQILVSQVDDARKLYDLAQSSFNQNELSSKAEHTDVSVLNRAFVPNVASGPNVFLSVLLAAAVGILLGISYALALEWMDGKVRSENDLGAIGLPLLGVVVSAPRIGWFNKA